jgi:anhydro-N-acetylmuramic acid kinase
MGIIKDYRFLGVMSGTSMDGLDLAVCTFSKNSSNWNYEVLSAATIPYCQSMKDMLHEAYNCTGRRLTEIDIEFGKYIGQQSKLFLDSNGLTVDFMASHGHTIFHEPAKGYTLQIGHGASIAANSGIKTVCNFRNLDVAFGGQGAPLVPIGDELLFGEYSACLNLGGFANISYNDSYQRAAFDICAVNFVLNKLCFRLGLDYDESGKVSSTGKRIEKLALQLNNLEYYRIAPPKSIGQEWAETYLMPVLGGYSDEQARDLLYTYTEHVAFQVSTILNNLKIARVLVTGGGAHNSFLVKKIREYTSAKLEIPGKILVDFKEAIIFAFLGVLRVCGEVNCLASVTGASKDSSGGTIYQG